MAPWIIQNFPPHRLYVEPFAGAASVLLQKPRSYNETLNDLDGDVVNLFQVLRGPDCATLLRQIELTPYARDEHRLAFVPAGDPVERARRMLIRSHMTHGTTGGEALHDRGFRVDGRSGTTNVANEWAALAKHLEVIAQRLRGVVIDNRDALDVIEDFDTPDALIYADPPYLPATRSDKVINGEAYHAYSHDMDEAGHLGLLERLRASRAMVVLSGYPSPLYEANLPGWREVRRAARAHRNTARVECLWLNPAAHHRHGLFGDL